MTGLIGAAGVFAVGWYSEQREAEHTLPFGALNLEQVNELDELPKLTRAEQKTVRAGWTTPALTALDRPIMSPARRAALLTLRVYLILTSVRVVVKLVEAGIR